MTNKRHQDQRIIKGIVKGEPKILQEIYSHCIKSSMDFVCRNGGTTQDAEDVVQERLVVIFKKARRGELQLTSSFSTYLFSVCRFIWWKTAKKRGNNIVTIGEDWGLIDESNIVEAVEKRERHQFYLKKLKELSASCRQILQLHIDGKKITYITKVMGFKTEGYTRKHKSRCKKQQIFLFLKVLTLLILAEKFSKVLAMQAKVLGALLRGNSLYYFYKTLNKKQCISFLH